MSGEQTVDKMTEKIIEAKEITVNKLFSEDFTFLIPFYQRPLTWSVDQFEQLIQDIHDSVNNVEGHFLGSVLLQFKSPRHYELVDGQQRMTALAILMAVIRDFSDRPDLKKTMQVCLYQEGNPLRRLSESMRIIPWKEMEELFRKYIYTPDGTRNFLDDFDKGDIPRHDVDDPQFHLFEAIDTFKKRLPADSKELYAFTDHLLNNVYMVHMITRSSLSSAFRLFHTLNTAGLDLTPSDILKAENLGAMKEVEKQKEYAEMWQSMEADLGRKAVAEIVAFIRTIKKKEKARLGVYEEYQQIFEKGGLERGAKFFDYVKEIAAVYKIKVLSPEIKSDNPEQRNRYKIVIDLMRKFIPFSDWVPPLLAFYHKFKSEEHMLDFTQKLERKVIVEWTAGFTEAERITSLNKIIKLIEEMSDPKEVAEKLLIYKTAEDTKSRAIDFNNDEEVKKSLESKLDDKRFYVIYGGKLAKYVLLRLDMEKWNLENFPGYLGTVTVEHILPQTPDEQSQWVKIFSKVERDEWTDKLGNLVLLGGRKNSSAQNFDFQKKKDIYFKGKSEAFKITQELESMPKWDMADLKNRHAKLIDNFVSMYS